MIWWLKKTLLRLKLYVEDCYLHEAESLITWYAVSFALGAGFYFAFPYELSAWVVVLYLELVLVLLYLYRHNNKPFKLFTYLLLFMLGLCVAKSDAMHRAKNIEIDINETSYLNGKIKVLDHNYNNRPRVLLTNVNNYEKDLKGDFKISLIKDEPWMKEGKCVELVAKLPKDFTPNPLVGTYNQDRNNFYKSISKVGYSISPVFEKDCKRDEFSIFKKISQIRSSIRDIINQYTSLETAPIITALAIGKTTDIDKQMYDNYRTSGLAHFLSISGMHMTIIALLVFFIFQVLLLPFTKGQYDLRKPASVLAIITTFLYFLISGQSVSCIRAFTMTTIILLAVLLNRRAISLRLWGFALMVVVAINPSSVVSPGFLMSFSAVLGLVAYYEKNEVRLHKWLDKQSFLRKLVSYMLGVIITDLVASLMTLPYSLYFFQQIAVYTTLGNMLAAPIITFYVMPALLLFLISYPLGLSKFSLPILENGIEIINHITTYVSNLPGANSGSNLPLLSSFGILLITLGMLWLCIWQAKWRKWGLLGIILGLSTMLFYSSPDFVFDKNGSTFAYRNNQGVLTMSKWQKNKFLKKVWQRDNKVAQKNVKDTTIKCNSDACIYKDRIEFKPNSVKLDGKSIPLKDGGYINLKTGIHYYQKENNRLWNK
ncbi:MAG: ComEC/Rec2 family competence protein [Alphaproteobacteria bacterium]|nr:ComEC/Rec2 family competence protein [Alphaproteobacteria bacterium]